MIRFLAAAAAVLAADPGAAGQEPADEAVASVDQISPAPDGRITADQLNIAMAEALASGRMDQLDLGERGVVILQAEGGADRCDPTAEQRSDFCDEILARREVMLRAQAASRAETDLATASPGVALRFSSDPAATADQIARGRPESFAAQAAGDALLGLHRRREDQPPPDAAPELSPELLEAIIQTPVGGGS